MTRCIVFGSSKRPSFSSLSFFSGINDPSSFVSFVLSCTPRCSCYSCSDMAIGFYCSDMAIGLLIGFRAAIKSLVCVGDQWFYTAKLPVWCLFLGQTNDFMRSTVILLCTLATVISCFSGPSPVICYCEHVPPTHSNTGHAVCSAFHCQQ